MITKMPDMDEMIQRCKDKLQDDEVICFAFGVGRIVPIFGKKKKMEEALDYIKKLEPCADMVSRDAMWEVLQRLYGTEGELVEELMSLPSVLPMPKIGKWIYRKEEDSYRCSLCTYPCHKDNLGAIPTKYCAGCGAVMEV